MERGIFCLYLLFASVGPASADPLAIDPALHHVRNGQPREWSSFPQVCDAGQYRVMFTARASAVEHTLRLVQQDVKQAWEITINNTGLGRLHRDENAIEGYWSIPADTLIDGTNELIVSTRSKTSDDIRIGHAVVEPRRMHAVLNDARLSVTVREANSGKVTACRITVVRADRLMTTGAESTDTMAVRPGVVYCAGTAEFGLPTGTFTIIAGRGPEYSIDTRTVTLQAGATEQIELLIGREVPTAGFVACDTHVHTLTHSGHGDSSMRERMLTLAGEGIELPIATDHNVHIDYRDLATELGVRSTFTPVIGNEVTTKFGHFNVFPVASGRTPIPNHKADNWRDLFDSIFSTPDVKIAILNHARDIHSGYRPFAPRHHLAVTGQNLDGWQLRANAMEVINSAAQQSDMMLLVRDWMGLLNAGMQITPVGCSDSHDVARHFVGQGRTYIRCDDSDPGNIDVSQAVDSFLAGRVIISCGLMADVRVNGKSGPGDTASAAESYQVEVTAMGASWTEAHEVEIFVNGRSVVTRMVDKDRRRAPGVKQTVTAVIPVPENQDSFMVAVVRGPGVTGLHWPVAKPYQPTSDDWVPLCMAVTGAVWIDADGDGRITSAREYARQLCVAADHDASRVLTGLQSYDAAVAVHAAAMLHTHDEDDFVSSVMPLARRQPPYIRQAFDSFVEAWRQSQRARAEPSDAP